MCVLVWSLLSILTGPFMCIGVCIIHLLHLWVLSAARRNSLRLLFLLNTRWSRHTWDTYIHAYKRENTVYKEGKWKKIITNFRTIVLMWFCLLHFFGSAKLKLNLNIYINNMQIRVCVFSPAKKNVLFVSVLCLCVSLVCLCAVFICFTC